MFFSSKVPTGLISEIKSIFNLNVVSKHEKYLGLPSMIIIKKSSFFSDIKLKVILRFRVGSTHGSQMVERKSSSKQ